MASSLPDFLDPENIPAHIAIIMDGNGRWARQKGNSRIFGHQSAIEAVRDTTEGAAAAGVQYLTLYAFSTENWNRPQLEVRALMELLVMTISKETPTLMENNIRLMSIGREEDLPASCRKQLEAAKEKTAGNTRMVLNLALSYGGRADLVQAVQSIATQVQQGSLSANAITEDTIRQNLSTHFLPDPELMIRTSGEFRISNFLLWELAYSEIYITPKFWPDFRREDLYEAIRDYQKRERRFGKTSEQIQAGS